MWEIAFAVLHLHPFYSTYNPFTVIEEHSASSFHITDITFQAQPFFDILPNDWQAAIQSFHDQIGESIKVVAIDFEDRVVGGGLLFSAQTSETDSYPKIAEYYFGRGYFYIGYLWVEEPFRGKQLGALWLHSVAEMFPENAFWLSIDDFGLAKFYERNGFTFASEVIYDGGLDRVYTKEPKFKCTLHNGSEC